MPLIVCIDTHRSCADVRVVAAVAGLGYLMMQGLGSLLVVGLLHAAMLAPIVPLSDALATTAAHESESDGQTAIRLWMAACIWLCRIHRWHDRRAVGSPGKLALLSIDLVERGAACYRRHRRALLLPKLPGGDAAQMGIGLRSCVIGLYCFASPFTVVCSSSQPWSKEVTPCTMRSP